MKKEKEQINTEEINVFKKMLDKTFIFGFVLGIVFVTFVFWLLGVIK